MELHWSSALGTTPEALLALPVEYWTLGGELVATHTAFLRQNSVTVKHR